MKLHYTKKIDRLFVIFSLILVLAIASACSSIESEDPETCNEGGAIFSDDFQGEADCGWQLYSGRGVDEAIQDGVLRIETSQPGLIGWTLAGQEVDDVVIATRAQQIGGPDDNAYGIICRYQNGREGIEYLTGEGMYAPSDIINKGQSINDLQASCIGNQLSFAVNGVQVAAASATN